MWTVLERVFLGVLYLCALGCVVKAALMWLKAWARREK